MIQKFIINGKCKLKGCVKISGSKNGALALICATILAPGVHTLKNIPELRDIKTIFKLLTSLGARIDFKNNTAVIDTSNINNFNAPYDLVKTMRAAVYVLGPLLVRYGKASISLPGGCAIGQRPINLHIDALKKLGAKINITHGSVEAKSGKAMKGAEIYFDKITVGATAHILMTATLVKGTTIIHNAAVEPEISELITYLNKMGARISGIDTDTLTIEGVEELKPVTFTSYSDRIETGTFIMAAAITRSELEIENGAMEHLGLFKEKITEAGIMIKQINNTTVKVIPGKYSPVEIETAPYPGFATDLQPFFMAFLSTVKGTSIIKEMIFENRFMQAAELSRMGADIETSDNIAIIKGTKKLFGAPVMASDLRGGTALLIAALRAEGKTTIDRIYHIDRGYEYIDKKLQHLGVKIERIK